MARNLPVRNTERRRLKSPKSVVTVNTTNPAVFQLNSVNNPATWSNSGAISAGLIQASSFSPQQGSSNYVYTYKIATTPTDFSTGQYPTLRHQFTGQLPVHLERNVRLWSRNCNDKLPLSANASLHTQCSRNNHHADQTQPQSM